MANSLKGDSMSEEKETKESPSPQTGNPPLENPLPYDVENTEPPNEAYVPGAGPPDPSGGAQTGGGSSPA